MVPAEKISSLQNPRVKQLVKLRDRRPRDEAGVFLVEGYREIRRALEKGVKLTELYFSADWFLGENEPALIAQARTAGATVFELSKEAFAKVAYRERPDGLLALIPQWRTKLAELELSEPPFLLVVEAIEKPGNLGTILRSADAAGVDAVIVCDPVTDLFNPNVVRSSTGVLFAMPVAIATTPPAMTTHGPAVCSRTVTTSVLVSGAGVTPGFGASEAAFFRFSSAAVRRFATRVSMGARSAGARFCLAR